MNALNAGTGALLWSRNAAADTHERVPGWGFARSPLVVDDILLVRNDHEMVAFRLSLAGG